MDLQDKEKERYARQLAEFEETGKFTPVSNADKSTDEGDKWSEYWTEFFRLNISLFG